MSNGKESVDPQSEEDRAARTEDLRRSGETDVERWQNFLSLSTSWDGRASRAANHIPTSSKVLDIGCGAMALRNYLKAGCIYTPADVVARDPSCLVVDLNKEQFPRGKFDWITMLGVLEYIHAPQWPLRMARRSSAGLVLTYCCDVSGDIAYRRGLGWVNDFTGEGVRALLAASGWSIVSESIDKHGKGNVQMMFVCN